jgi:hypothetical protein
MRPHGTDIELCDFDDLSVEPKDRNALQQYKHSIEVHSLHLTAWRDENYRNSNATGSDATRTRTDWDKKTTPLVEAILGTLKRVSEMPSKWDQPLTRLHEASAARYRDKAAGWPPILIPEHAEYLKGRNV